MRSQISLVALVVLAALSAVRASAQDNTVEEPGAQSEQAQSEQAQSEQEARARFEAGRALVQVGSYEAARLEFRRGYQLSERPLFIFNMAECARHLRNVESARREYAEYVRQDPEGAFVAMAQTRLQELGEGDTSTPDFVRELNEPDLETPDIDPATVVSDPVMDVSAPVETDSFEPPPPERAWYKDWPFWTTVGVAVAAGVVTGIVLGTRSDSCASGCEEFDWRGL